MLKKILLSPWTAIITLILLLAVRAIDPTFVESVRLRYFDTLITSKAPTQNNIYTVNIDEAALDKYGQWPLPRDQYARIIQDLYQRGAGLVVLNVLMAEPDRTGGDAVLANALRQYPVVLPSVPSAQTKNTPKKPGSAVIGAEYSDLIVQYPGLIANIRSLEASAVGVGIVNTLPEVDGVNRRLPLVVAVDGKVYPSLSMETLRVAAGDNTFQVKMSEIGVEKMRIPAFGPITTDNLGRVWVDLSQQSQSVSLTNLPKDFGGAIVIVGPSAAGIANPIPTARGAVWPQEFQASAIGTMINGVVITRPDYADGLEILTMLAVGVILLFLTRYVYVGLACVAVTSVAAVAGSYFAYNHLLWLYDITALVGTILLVSLHAYGVKFVSEFLQKQQIKKQFGTYLSPAMVERLQKNPELLQLGGESRELSIMFTDVRGFTSISEHYGQDVQGLTKIMNRYMTAMTAKIIDNQGTLDKYIGDAQMAFWNAPLDDPEHARHAVDTALQMLGDLDAFNQSIATEGVPPFGMGLGINTGTVVVGNMGSDQRFDYTCLGDSVNLASRLEGQSKPYGVKIVLGSKTAEYVKQDYLVLELDCIAVKGKTQGVNIYTVLGRRDQLNTERGDEQMHGAMLELYRQQKFDRAIQFCQDLKGRFGGEMDHYYDAWTERCEEMKHVELPRDWDGVFRATSK
ncbi:COG4252 Predicted transmembrane sensor domain [uncultured Caudovirales phage]|uniref:COG4252 Predicted transmembrane sensor domain n=1 Tax=uncultured Caudovirales phage TaxID=2100421 RepID=A0A6J5LVV9_9CAUD|nr:COG4252 Predicted transmembrane sensor domain [uncultured Caudovirales phage]